VAKKMLVILMFALASVSLLPACSKAKNQDAKKTSEAAYLKEHEEQINERVSNFLKLIDQDTGHVGTMQTVMYNGKPLKINGKIVKELHPDFTIDYASVKGYFSEWGIWANPDPLTNIENPSTIEKAGDSILADYYLLFQVYVKGNKEHRVNIALYFSSAQGGNGLRQEPQTKKELDQLTFEETNIQLADPNACTYDDSEPVASTVDTGNKVLNNSWWNFNDGIKAQNMALTTKNQVRSLVRTHLSNLTDYVQSQDKLLKNQTDALQLTGARPAPLSSLSYKKNADDSLTVSVAYRYEFDADYPKTDDMTVTITATPKNLSNPKLPIKAQLTRVALEKLPSVVLKQSDQTTSIKLPTQSSEIK
jgi:hypothetical protein